MKMEEFPKSLALVLQQIIYYNKKTDLVMPQMTFLPMDTHTQPRGTYADPIDMTMKWVMPDGKHVSDKFVEVYTKNIKKKIKNALSDPSLNTTRRQRVLNKKEKTRKEQQSSPTGLHPAIKRWQAAIKRIIKENKHHKEETLKHAAESEQRRRIRAACKEAKDRKESEWEHKPLPGIAPATGKWAEEPKTASELAAAKGKKAVALEERRERIRKQVEEERARMAKEAAEQAERDRLLQVGFAITGG